MSRSDQWIGLPPEAEEWIEKHNLQSIKSEVALEMAFDVGSVSLREFYEPGIDPETGMYVCREVEQCTPWSSGPCYFTKLVDAYNRDIFSWSPADIRNV